MEKKNIRVDIAGRSYPLTVKAAQAQVLEDAAVEIEIRMEDLKKRYAVRDKHDLLAMVLLETIAEEKNIAASGEAEKEELRTAMEGLLDELDIH